MVNTIKGWNDTKKGENVWKRMKSWSWIVRKKEKNREKYEGKGWKMDEIPKVNWQEKGDYMGKNGFENKSLLARERVKIDYRYLKNKTRIGWKTGDKILIF